MTKKEVAAVDARPDLHEAAPESDPTKPGTAESKPKPRPQRRRAVTSLFAVGEPMIWLTGGALVLCLVMVLGLLALIFFYGMATFWPLEIVRYANLDGTVYMGEVTRFESFQPAEETIRSLPPEEEKRAREQMRESDGSVMRSLIRTGNFKLTQNHFQWVEDFKIAGRTFPRWVLVLERMEWGRFYGFPEAFVIKAKTIEPRDDEGNFKSPAQKKEEALAAIEAFSPRHGGVYQVLAEVYEGGEQRQCLLAVDELDAASDIIAVAEVLEGAGAAWDGFKEFHDEVLAHLKERRSLEKFDTGEVNEVQEEARLAVKEAELDLRDARAEFGLSSSLYAAAREKYNEAEKRFAEKEAWAGKEFTRIRRQIEQINEQNGRYLISMVTAGEGEQPPQRRMMRLDEIVRAYPANQLTFFDKIGIYFSRWWEYLSDEPREANSEGGVFPAIFGTVVMTLMMALAVVPFGVLAALYLREYAKAGPVVSAVRIAVNNLAGVPSIVFGVFGLGFFCYGVGSFIDGGPSWVMPETSWFIVLSVTAVVAAAAFFTYLRSVNRPGTPVTTAKRALRYSSIVLWIGATITLLVLVATTPFFDGFYRGSLPNPTFGKGALIWASFTLALMTLPVVIVATEEALSAVPNSMREGSYACGASKWQTIRRIVLPRALPGIMTGMILAMARGAGEVAPLMLVGAVKLAPELPLDLGPPFGLNRSFMHLGFHIYDVGFQSQNSEAAKPMVFTTTLLLIFIIAVMNIFAVWMRSRLRRRFVSDQF